MSANQETYIKIKKTWTNLYRAVDSEGNTLEFLLSPTRDAEAAKRFLVKALHATACSAPQARPVEEQVEEPTAAADPITTSSAPRVINVDKNAAYPKAIADLKASGMLPESVELKPGQILEQPDGARPPLHQTAGQAGAGLLFRENSRANVTGIRGDEHDSQGTGQRGEQRRQQRAGHLHRQPLLEWPPKPNKKGCLLAHCVPREFLQHNHGTCALKTTVSNVYSLNRTLSAKKTI